MRTLVPGVNLVRQVRRFLAEELGPGGEGMIWLMAVMAQEIRDSGGDPWRLSLVRMGRHATTSVDYRPPISADEAWKPVLSAGVVALLGEVSTQWQHTAREPRGVMTVWVELRLGDHPSEWGCR
ncbi:hypothetical protein [Nocardiopsis sp. NPDC006938]|uniref:hypothetical protein n=1 Tax=Nocardiopsis sp. NPDC006938 TaxID=3364337 RepID=UPI00367C9704